MMANERQRRLMQEALDNTLSPEGLQELRARLDQDATETAEFNRLRHIDRLLRAAPFERAPQTLALKIIARLAAGLDPQQVTRASGLALALGLALVTLALLPLMATIGWLILNTVGNASALSALISHIAGLLAAFMNTLQAMVKGAQIVLDTYPELPVVMLTTIPIAVFWLLRFAADTRQSRRQD
jgi:anti-sigma factor RsiW